MNGWYTLFYSGNAYNTPHYAIGVARAQAITGPWETNPKNPILQSAPGMTVLVVSGRHKWPTYTSLLSLAGDAVRVSISASFIWWRPS